MIDPGEVVVLAECSGRGEPVRVDGPLVVQPVDPAGDHQRGRDSGDVVAVRPPRGGGEPVPLGGRPGSVGGVEDLRQRHRDGRRAGRPLAADRGRQVERRVMQHLQRDRRAAEFQRQPGGAGRQRAARGLPADAQPRAVPAVPGAGRPVDGVVGLLDRVREAVLRCHVVVDVDDRHPGGGRQVPAQRVVLLRVAEHEPAPVKVDVDRRVRLAGRDVGPVHHRLYEAVPGRDRNRLGLRGHLGERDLPRNARRRAALGEPGERARDQWCAQKAHRFNSSIGAPAPPLYYLTSQVTAKSRTAHNQSVTGEYRQQPSSRPSGTGREVNREPSA